MLVHGIQVATCVPKEITDCIGVLVKLAITKNGVKMIIKNDVELRTDMSCFQMTNVGD